MLLEKETVMGAELDGLIRSMRPGITLQSKGHEPYVKKDQPKPVVPPADPSGSASPSDDAP